MYPNPIVGKSNNPRAPHVTNPPKSAMYPARSKDMIVIIIQDGISLNSPVNSLDKSL
jgi:hypothetical protein